MHSIEMATHTDDRFYSDISITFSLMQSTMQLQVPENIITLKILFVQFSMYIVVRFIHVYLFVFIVCACV